MESPLFATTAAGLLIGLLVLVLAPSCCAVRSSSSTPAESARTSAGSDTVAADGSGLLAARESHDSVSEAERNRFYDSAHFRL
ncbi:hypothetical protein ACFO5R_20185 [Halosolutus amylolyticus]|uniref:Secreted protein n=1 Tax=Halosolutus amylolyticus TaxID=2932267 RepID=A0ABD5PUE9_9EURY|nr:hypothetical protein [Halosolutus amylolyticus]